MIFENYMLFSFICGTYSLVCSDIQTANQSHPAIAILFFRHQQEVGQGGEMKEDRKKEVTCGKKNK